MSPVQSVKVQWRSENPALPRETYDGQHPREMRKRSPYCEELLACDWMPLVD
jgi:hypothetical protein